MDLFSLFKEFYSVAIVNKYPANVRGVYDSILYDFNARFFPEHCIYTQRELSELTGLSLEPLHRALKFLAQRGHIKIKASKRGTVIRLCEECQTQAKHEPNTRQTQGAAFGLVPYTPQAHAEVNNNNLKTKNEETKKEEESAGASESKSATDSTEMDVHDLWEHETGFALHGSVAYELESLEKTYGRESFHSALIKAVQSNTANRLNFNYFKKVLENLNKPKTTSNKGGERYEQPDTSKDPDWL